MEVTMDLLLIFLWAIPYILWMALFHLWLSNKCFVCGYKDDRVRPTLIALELSIDLIIAIFYFEGPFHPISNFIISLFKN
jgi:hypothetical protein